jgi:hypothetical protein
LATSSQLKSFSRLTRRPPAGSTCIHASPGTLCACCG